MKRLRMAAIGCMACAVAQADVQTVKVSQVGGQAAGLFVVFSQTVGTDLSCPGTRLIVSASQFADADTFKRFYAGMLTAMVTGGLVTLSVSGCATTFPSMIPSDFWFMQSN